MTGETEPAQRAVFFIDGANIFRRFKDEGVDFNAYDLRKVAAKLAKGRDVKDIRYYDGKLDRSSPNFGLQQSLFSFLEKQGVTIVLGRVEQRETENVLAAELKKALASIQSGPTPLPPPVHGALSFLANKHKTHKYWTQKAVDTLLVGDMARMAADDEFDVAYVLSLDGDMTPGIEFARSRGKKVFGAGPRGPNYAVKNACDAFIVFDKDWLLDCFPDPGFARPPGSPKSRHHK